MTAALEVLSLKSTVLSVSPEILSSTARPIPAASEDFTTCIKSPWSTKVKPLLERIALARGIRELFLIACVETKLILPFSGPLIKIFLWVILLTISTKSLISRFLKLTSTVSSLAAAWSSIMLAMITHNSLFNFIFQFLLFIFSDYGNRQSLYRICCFQDTHGAIKIDNIFTIDRLDHIPSL